MKSFPLCCWHKPFLTPKIRTDWIARQWEAGTVLLSVVWKREDWMHQHSTGKETKGRCVDLKSYIWKQSKVRHAWSPSNSITWGYRKENQLSCRESLRSVHRQEVVLATHGLPLLKEFAPSKFPLLIPEAGKSYTFTEDKKKKIWRYKSLLLFPSFGKKPKTSQTARLLSSKCKCCYLQHQLFLLLPIGTQHSSHKSLLSSVAFADTEEIPSLLSWMNNTNIQDIRGLTIIGIRPSIWLPSWIRITFKPSSLPHQGAASSCWQQEILGSALVAASLWLLPNPKFIIHCAGLSRPAFYICLLSLVLHLHSEFFRAGMVFYCSTLALRENSSAIVIN